MLQLKFVLQEQIKDWYNWLIKREANASMFKDYASACLWAPIFKYIFHFCNELIHKVLQIAWNNNKWSGSPGGLKGMRMSVLKKRIVLVIFASRKREAWLKKHFKDIVLRKSFFPLVKELKLNCIKTTCGCLVYPGQWNWMLCNLCMYQRPHSQRLMYLLLSWNCQSSLRY